MITLKMPLGLKIHPISDLSQNSFAPHALSSSDTIYMKNSLTTDPGHVYNSLPAFRIRKPNVHKKTGRGKAP